MYAYVRRDLPTLEKCKETCLDLMFWCGGVMYETGQCSFLGKKKLSPHNLMRKTGATLYLLSHDCNNDSALDKINQN